jgi:glutathione S-transferase
MAIVFHYSPMSSATRCHWALEELGVPYEKVRIDLTKKDQKTAQFLALNPNGKIPVLVDDGARIFESLAIILWLGEKYGVEKGLWPRVGSAEHAEALSWSVWGTSELFPPIFDRLLHAADRSFSYPPEQRSAAVAMAAGEKWKGMAKILDDHLANRAFMLGKDFTLVDVALGSLCAMAGMMAGLPLEGASNVAAWVGRCQSRPALGRAMQG